MISSGENFDSDIFSFFVVYQDQSYFAKATDKVAYAFSSLKGAKVIVGSGDTVSAIGHLVLEGSFYHVSTGGGASLTFLEGTELPGVAALKENFYKFR